MNSWARMYTHMTGLKPQRWCCTFSSGLHYNGAAPSNRRTIERHRFESTTAPHARKRREEIREVGDNKTADGAGRLGGSCDGKGRKKGGGAWRWPAFCSRPGKKSSEALERAPRALVGAALRGAQVGEWWRNAAITWSAIFPSARLGGAEDESARGEPAKGAAGVGDKTAASEANRGEKATEMPSELSGAGREGVFASLGAGQLMLVFSFGDDQTGAELSDLRQKEETRFIFWQKGANDVTFKCLETRK